MHRRLKEATATPPKRDIKEQQEVFDEFVLEHNLECPHEALGQKTPDSFYRLSMRPYPIEVPKVEYHGDVIVRQVRHNGEIRWKGKLVYLSEALAGEPMALMQKEEHLWEIRFSYLTLGVLDELTGRITPLLIKQGREVLPMCPV